MILNSNNIKLRRTRLNSLPKLSYRYNEKLGVSIFAEADRLVYYSEAVFYDILVGCNLNG
jgi:hypothetical protein